jgi:hypothetical protein
MDITQVQNLLHEIVKLKHDTIYHPNSWGASWNSCRLCYASKDEVRGVYQHIEHEPDCPGIVAEKLLEEMGE